MVTRPLAVLLLCLSGVRPLFPGATPDDGDTRHMYPVGSLAVAVGQHSPFLPYLLGWIENAEYPKQRLHINFYLLPAAKEDASREQLKWWKGQVSKLFGSVSVVDSWNLENSWQETALRSARQSKSSFVLLWSADYLPKSSRLLKWLFSDRQETEVLTSFLVRQPFDEGWNYDYLGEDEAEYDENKLELSTADLPLLIDLRQQDAAYVTFDAGSLMAYEPQTDDPMDVISEAAHRLDIPIYLDRSRDIAWFFNATATLAQKTSTLKYLLADLIADRGPLPLPVSQSVRPYVPQKGKKFGFDKIFVINLARRPERRAKMDAICKAIGLECTMFDATDGNALPQGMTIKQLPGYIDPYYQRPMKNGEIGCFLSHYRIWEEVSKRELDRVLVLEDDVRFANRAMEELMETMEDVEAHHTQWGLIYIGRKKLHQEEHRELWVPDHRHLSTVGYSYWTVGYALSLSGAQALLKPRPLERIVPVDEYIPIMFDAHPNRTWSQAFEERNLVAFTLHPLIVYPQKYTYEPGYVSDTEESEVISDEEARGGKDEL